MKAGAGGENVTAVITENVEPQKTNRADKGGDNSTRPLAVTAPSGNVNDLSSTAAASKPEPISLPAQVAREQIASGKELTPLPEPRARGKGQRVVGAARDAVEERLGPRVEKLRHASTVVWSEAQDDPNLRFILVAVFLFILAIVIILLGTYIK
jgi:hypothetical protein